MTLLPDSSITLWAFARLSVKASDFSLVSVCLAFKLLEDAGPKFVPSQMTSKCGLQQLGQHTLR